MLTEAEYKNFDPVARDTVIFDAVKFYRKHGPEDKLARSLMMQGAVYKERNELSKAMESYIEAEPLFESTGDFLQLGLINTRIAELYQNNIVDTKSALERYKKALSYFEKLNSPRLIVGTTLSMGRILISDSTDFVEPYLRKAMETAIEIDDSLAMLSGYDLYTYYYIEKKDYSSAIDIARHVFSTFGKVPENETEMGFYRSILKNYILSYVFIGEPDSARFYTSRFPLNTQRDSLSYYTVLMDIASAENSWKEAFGCQENVYRIMDEIMQSGYDAQLVEVEEKYKNSMLREELYKRNNRILVLVIVFVGVLAVASAAFFLLRRLLDRQKAEIVRQTGIARRLHDTASRLELDLRSKASEADALKLEKQQEEDARRELESMLRQQSDSNHELLRYYAKAQKAMHELVDIYDAKGSNPEHFMDDALSLARDFIKDMNSPRNAATVIEAAYPGFLGSLFAEFPGLQEEDRHLIILTCCGYPSGAIGTILGISESNLAVRKTRLARRMGIDTSLAKFLRRRLASWRSKEE